MLLGTMDEALEEGPIVELSERELRLAKIEEINTGDEFILTCKAVVVECSENEGEDGTPETCARFELTRICLEGDKEQPTQQEQRHKMQAPVEDSNDRINRFYGRG